MSKLQQLMEEFREENRESFPLDPNHRNYDRWTTMQSEPDALGFFNQDVWTAVDKWTRDFGPEWARFLVDECPELIDARFHYVPDKQWLHDVLREHHELLIPFIEDVNWTLSDLINEAMDEEIKAYNDRLIEHRAWLRATPSPK